MLQAKVLITRPREEAKRLAEALAERDLDPLVEPLLQIRWRDAALPDLVDVQAVLCTSANGVRALARATANRALPLLAVGEATALRARAEGFASVASAGGTVADLVQLAAARLDPHKGAVLHAAGSDVAGDLAGDMRARGFTVERVALYRAEPAAALSPEAVAGMRAGHVCLALFFSPRTASVFARLAKGAGVAGACAEIVAVSISAAADGPLAALVWRDRRIAATPDQAAVLAAIDKVCTEAR